MSSLFSLILEALFFLSMMSLVFWSNWKAHTRRGFAYFCGMFLWMGVMVYSMISSAVPSSAPRKQIKGRLLGVYAHGNGKSKTYTFNIVLDSGSLMRFREGVSPPRDSYGQLLLVTYLDEKIVGNYPRAIAAENLTGPYIGVRNSVNANWIGTWIFCPIGVLGIIWSNFKARQNLSTKIKAKNENRTDITDQVVRPISR